MKCLVWPRYGITGPGLKSILLAAFLLAPYFASQTFAAADPQIVDTNMMIATGGQFNIYINGAPHRPGADAGTEANANNKDLREEKFSRVTMLAVKEVEKIGPNQPMMLSYRLEVKFKKRTEKIFHSNQIKDHRVWFDPDGQNPPPKDPKGHQWFDLEYDDSQWTKGNNIDTYDPPFRGVEPVRNGRVRLKFLSIAPNRASSATQLSVQYYRRRIVLWGKPPKPTPTPKPTLTPVPPTPAPTPTPKPTATISPTRTVTQTVTLTVTSTATPTYTLTLKPDEPTPLPTETPLPSLTPTEIIEDTAVPTEPPTLLPTAEDTATPTESPLPTQPPATRTPTEIPALLLNGFEKEADLMGITGRYMTLSLSRIPEGISQGEGCARVRIRLASAFGNSVEPLEETRVGPKGSKITLRGVKATPTPRPYLPTLKFGFDTPTRLRTTDFSKFKKIALDVTNPGRAGLNIILSLADAKGYEFSFRAKAALPLARTAIEVDLTEAREARLDLGMIRSLSVGVDVRGQSRDPILYFDFLRLE